MTHCFFSLPLVWHHVWVSYHKNLARHAGSTEGPFLDKVGRVRWRCDQKKGGRARQGGGTTAEKETGTESKDLSRCLGKKGATKKKTIQRISWLPKQKEHNYDLPEWPEGHVTFHLRVRCHFTKSLVRECFISAVSNFPSGLFSLSQ